MKIISSFTIFVLVITALFASLFTVNAQTPSTTRREWALLDPQGGEADGGYHTLIFKETSSSSWNSVSLPGSLSNANNENLCALVGYVGSQITAQYRTISPPSGYPAGMTFTGCSGVNSNDRVLYKFEDQCQFSTSGGSTAVQIKCSGYRTGSGAYGVPSGPDTYIKLDYNGVFYFRDAFSTDWKVLCDDSTTTTTAGRICTALDGGKTTRTGTYYAGTRPTGESFVGRGASCPSNAVNFSQCSYSTSTSGCFSSEAYSLQCSQFNTPISSGGYHFRMDQSNNRALIDVKPTSSSTYGRICDDGFGSEDATFFCKLLGFPSNAASFGSTSSGTFSSTPIYLKNIGCSSSYTSFSSCSKTTAFSDCFASESVYLICPDPINQAGTSPVASGTFELRTLTESPVGQLQVRGSSSGTWQLICDDSFSFDTASRIGSYLGRNGQCSWQSGAGKTGQVYAFSNVKCYANSGNFGGCSKTTSHHCSISSEAVEINKCWNTTDGLLVGSYAIRLSTDGDYRLEVRDRESKNWGQVVYSSSSTNARSLCSMFGFSTSSVSYTRKYLKTGTIKMNNLYCSSAKSDLASCTFSTSVSGLDISETALLGLRCGTMETPSTSSSKRTTEPNIGLIIGATMGGIIGLIVFIVVIVSCAAASSNSSNSSSSAAAAPKTSLGLTTAERQSNMDADTRNQFFGGSSAGGAPVVAGAPMGGNLNASWGGNNTGYQQNNTYPTGNSNFEMSSAPPPPPPGGGYPGGYPGAPGQPGNSPFPPQNNQDYAYGVPPGNWNQQQMNFIPGYGQNFAPNLPPPTNPNGY